MAYGGIKSRSVLQEESWLHAQNASSRRSQSSQDSQEVGTECCTRADRLLKEAQKALRRRSGSGHQSALRRTGQVLKAAGRAAIVAGVAAGIARRGREPQTQKKKR